MRETMSFAGGAVAAEEGMVDFAWRYEYEALAALGAVSVCGRCSAWLGRRYVIDLKPLAELD